MEKTTAKVENNLNRKKKTTNTKSEDLQGPKKKKKTKKNITELFLLDWRCSREAENLETV